MAETIRKATINHSLGRFHVVVRAHRVSDGKSVTQLWSEAVRTPDEAVALVKHWGVKSENAMLIEGDRHGAAAAH